MSGVCPARRSEVFVVFSGGSKPSAVISGVSEKIMELARKQRMNTDVRKNIFCIIMTSEVCNNFCSIMANFVLKLRTSFDPVFLVISGFCGRVRKIVEVGFETQTRKGDCSRHTGHQHSGKTVQSLLFVSAAKVLRVPQTFSGVNILERLCCCGFYRRLVLRYLG